MARFLPLNMADHTCIMEAIVRANVGERNERAHGWSYPFSDRRFSSGVFIGVAGLPHQRPLYSVGRKPLPHTRQTGEKGFRTRLVSESRGHYSAESEELDHQSPIHAICTPKSLTKQQSHSPFFFRSSLNRPFKSLSYWMHEASKPRIFKYRKGGLPYDGL